MFALRPLRQSLRRPLLRNSSPRTSPPTTRRTSTNPPPPAPSHPRIAKLLSKLPPRLHRHLSPLSSAPISHITSFLLLHELTAILPLFTLASLFHYTGWLPSWFSEGTWVLYGVQIFGSWFRKRGWISGSEGREAVALGKEEEEKGEKKGTRRGMEVWKGKGKWDMTEGGVRLVVEFATAYAVVKALLPLRIIASVWATPWFAARVVIPVGRGLRSIFKRKKREG